MAKNFSEGSKVRYVGPEELPEDYDTQRGVVIEVKDSAGGQLATVEFGGPGKTWDVFGEDLERDPIDAQHYDDDGNPFE